jgi:hypothetical protein
VYYIVAEAARTSSACGPPRDAKPLQPSESTNKAFGGSADILSFSALQQSVAKSALHAVHAASHSAAKSSSTSLPSTAISQTTEALVAHGSSSSASSAASTKPESSASMGLKPTIKKHGTFVSASTHIWIPPTWNKYDDKAKEAALKGKPTECFCAVDFGQGQKKGGTQQHVANRLQSLLRWKELARIHGATLPPDQEAHHEKFLKSLDSWTMSTLPTPGSMGSQHMKLLRHFESANNNTYFVTWFGEKWAQYKCKFLIAA